MTLNFVTLTGTLPNAGGAVVEAVLSGWTPDVTDELLFPPAGPPPVTLANATVEGQPAGTFSLGGLVANDNANLPAGTYWTVTIKGIAGVPLFTGIYVLDYANGASQDISGLVQYEPPPAPAALMPLPSGGNPAAGQYPAATGAGEASEWTDVSGPADWLNAVTQYQADRTGAANATAALQDMLNALAAGQTGYTPQGKYQTTAPLVTPPYATDKGSAGQVFSIADSGTVIVPSAAWAQGAAPSAAVKLLLNATDGDYATPSEEQKISDLMIDASNMTVQADGIQGYGAVNSVRISKVAVNFQLSGTSPTSSVAGNGISQAAAHGASPDTWRGEDIIVHRAGLSGYVLVSPDSTWKDCEASGCGQQGTNVPAWAIGTCSNSTFIGIRGENQGGTGNGITYTGANSGGGGVTFSAPSTQGNGGHGMEITSAGNSGSGPVSVVGGRFNNDGWNPYFYLQNPAGNGGGGFAGIFITNAASPISLTGCQVIPGVAGSGNSPQYGLKVTSNNGTRPGSVNVSGCLLWGASAAFFSDGTTPVNFDSACVFGSGTGAAPTFYVPGVPTAISAAGNLIPAARPDLALLPAGATGSSIPRNLVTVSNVAFVSGDVYLVPVFLVAGCPVNNLNFFQGGTVETAGTHGWYVLCDSTRTVRAVTADQTGATFFGTADVAVGLPVAATYVPPVTGYYYMGVCTVVSSGNVPNWQTGTALAGNQAAGITGAPNMGGTSSTGQTTPPSIGTVLSAISGAAADQLFGWTS
jgi:hypothetical protein